MMRRLADDLVLSLKDQIRTLRYSLRSEAEAPGSALPEAYRNVDFGPLGTVGAMIGTPVIRMADGLFTQVEHVTLGLLEGPPARTVFPRPVTDYFGRGEDKPAFTQDLYRESKALLRRHGARQALVSEHSMEDLRNEIGARHRDLIGTALARRQSAASDERDDSTVKLCAAIAAGFARVRPIQKLDLLGTPDLARHLMIAPNCYCGLVLGLSIAIATTRPQARDLDSLELIESADAVVDARFDRFKVALDGKDAVMGLAREFETVLPFLP
jgi:hypothetical protein